LGRVRNQPANGESWLPPSGWLALACGVLRGFVNLLLTGLLRTDAELHEIVLCIIMPAYAS
jgi:hypothetical protein